jgi:CBS domain-containing protein
MKTGISVSDAMTNKPVMLEEKNTIQQCAKLMAEKKVGAMLVGKGQNLKGILSDQDIVRKCIAKGINPLTKKIGDFMNPIKTTITPDKDIYDAIMLMKENNIRHLPVMDGKKLIGLLTLKDILKIEPQLFDIIVEEIELREEDKKPIFKQSEKEGICQECGNYTEILVELDGVLVCKKCKKANK